MCEYEVVVSGYQPLGGEVLSSDFFDNRDSAIERAAEIIREVEGSGDWTYCNVTVCHGSDIIESVDARLPG